MTWDNPDCRIATRPVDDLSLIIDEMRNGLPSVRHEMFLQKGVTCVVCSRCATHVIAWRDLRYLQEVGSRGLHIDLLCVEKDGTEVLMTADHIVPKSLGGPKSVENFQPMCAPCNQAKGNTPPEGWVDTRDPATVKKCQGGLKEETDQEAARRTRLNRQRRARRKRAKLRQKHQAAMNKLLDITPASLLVSDPFDI